MGTRDRGGGRQLAVAEAREEQTSVVRGLGDGTLGGALCLAQRYCRHWAMED